MADGVLYIVPLEQLEIRTETVRHPAEEWLCTERYDEMLCMEAAGQRVTSLFIYAENGRAIDLLSRKPIGRILTGERGSVLDLDGIRAPLIAADPVAGYSCEASPAEVRAGLDPLRPYAEEISACFAARCENIRMQVRQETAAAAAPAAPLQEEYQRISGNDGEAETVGMRGKTGQKPDAQERPKKTKTAKSSKKGKGRKKGKRRKNNGKGLRITLIVLAVLVLLFAMFRVYKSFNSKCGKDVSWRYAEESNLLIVSGSGETWDYPMSLLKLKAPWERAGYSGQIYNLILDEGVTAIGDGLFRDTSLTSVTIPYSVTEIGAEAFRGCKLLARVNIPITVQSIGENAFCTEAGESQILTIVYAGTAQEWATLVGDTHIDTEGYYIRVSCSDYWIVQTDTYGMYEKIGEDEWVPIEG